MDLRATLFAITLLFFFAGCNDSKLADGPNGGTTTPTPAETATPGPTPQVTPGPALRIAGGLDNTCVVTATGLWCWGVTFGTVPERLDSDSIATISAGALHFCGVLAGEARCWGYNQSGQLGDGTTDTRWEPEPVSGLSSGVQSVSAGHDHSCAVVDGGGLRCWGKNLYGQLGDGTTTDRLVPVPVPGLGSVSMSAPGESFTCVLETSGTARCWGEIAGIPTIQPAPVPALPPGGVEIVAGASHACVRTVAGEVWCWGQNAYGQLGDGTTSSRFDAARVTLPAAAAQIASEYIGACARLVTGAIHCWGHNDYGQLGDGTTTLRTAPVAVQGFAGATTITTGEYHTCGLTSGGGVVCWGQALANGFATDLTTPAALAAFP